MARYQAILFDLDGTIIDSASGIFHTLEHTLEQFGVHAPRSGFVRHLGPPMRQSIAEYLPAEKVEEALTRYRAEYARVGVLQCTLYPGVPALLQALREAGCVLCIATSKPRVFAQAILKRLGVAEYFDYIGGADMDTRLDTKESVMRDVMAKPCVTAHTCVMVGDRCYDMEGAAACAVPSVGVLYGYGTRQELEAYAPEFMAQTTQELCTYLLQMPKG